MSSAEYKPGTKMPIRIALPINSEGEKRVALTITVRRVEKDGEGFRAGCSLDSSDAKERNLVSEILRSLSLGNMSAAAVDASALAARAPADSAGSSAPAIYAELVRLGGTRGTAMKLDWKKDDKRYYLPKAEPEELFVPAFNFFAIDGAGDPNGQEFPAYIEALYAASYAVKMSPKKGKAPPEYADYAVYPLEGVWDISDEAKARGGAWDKKSLVFTLMMRQPDFVRPEYARSTLEELAPRRLRRIP
jgi:hypothetical protein